MASTPFNCHRCNAETQRLISNPNVPGVDCVCRACADELSHSGRFGRFDGIALPAHSSERAVVWRNPETGKCAYPPVNSAEMPDRYKVRGFERVELPNLRDIERHERDNKVRSEIAHYDRGSGRGPENG